MNNVLIERTIAPSSWLSRFCCAAGGFILILLCISSQYYLCGPREISPFSLIEIVALPYFATGAAMPDYDLPSSARDGWMEDSRSFLIGTAVGVFAIVAFVVYRLVN